MPELPEVETMRRGILSVVGRQIVAVTCPQSTLQSIEITPSLARLRKQVCGQTIRDVSRRGKRVLVHLEDGAVIVMEPRMAGLILLDNPPTEKHLRLCFHLEDRSVAEETAHFLFWDKRGLGKVHWLDSSQIEPRLGRERLGPDALEVTARILKERLGGSRRPIKVALLDQKGVAGIGNLYASEILHWAGIDPRLACTALTLRQWERVSCWTRRVLEQAIEHEGSTLADGTYRNALSNPGGYQNHHRVYDRGGEVCLQCRAGTIKRIVQAQRSTYYCPVCQCRRGVHPAVIV